MCFSGWQPLVTLIIIVERIKGVYQYQSFQKIDFIPDITEQFEGGPKHLYISAEEKIIMADIFDLCRCESCRVTYCMEQAAEVWNEGKKKEGYVRENIPSHSSVNSRIKLGKIFLFPHNIV